MTAAIKKKLIVKRVELNKWVNGKRVVVRHLECGHSQREVPGGKAPYETKAICKTCFPKTKASHENPK